MLRDSAPPAEDNLWQSLVERGKSHFPTESGGQQGDCFPKELQDIDLRRIHEIDSFLRIIEEFLDEDTGPTGVTQDPLPGRTRSGLRREFGDLLFVWDQTDLTIPLFPQQPWCLQECRRPGGDQLPRFQNKMIGKSI
jgi:hypothetical protein